MLLTVAVPRYFQSVESAKQTVLVDNLRQTRDILDKYYADTGAFPETLDELVEKHYLKALPFDPVAQSALQWILVRPKEGVRGRVADVHSGAPGVDRMGRPFSDL
jgi:general secretion pathway protein G